MDEVTRQAVRARADERCEYCRIRQTHYLMWRHQIEHIVPRKHRGSDSLDNLALACVRCNLGKSSNLSGIDPLSGDVVQLFNPRLQNWREHFEFQEISIVGKTPCCPASVGVFNMNEPQRLRLRFQLLENNELD